VGRIEPVSQRPNHRRVSRCWSSVVLLEIEFNRRWRRYHGLRGGWYRHPANHRDRELAADLCLRSL